MILWGFDTREYFNNMNIEKALKRAFLHKYGKQSGLGRPYCGGSRSI